MTRGQAKEILEQLNDVIDKFVKDEDVLEDTKSALDFAIADMNTLQEVMDCVSCVMDN